MFTSLVVADGGGGGGGVTGTSGKSIDLYCLLLSAISRWLAVGSPLMSMIWAWLWILGDLDGTGHVVGTVRFFRGLSWTVSAVTVVD